MTRPLWYLKRGGETLAMLRPDGLEVVPDLDRQFTIEAAYELTPAFERVRHLFEREIALLDDEGEAEQAEWADIWDELMGPGLFVESADGKERRDILWIHFLDGRAWWWPLDSRNAGSGGS